MFFGLFVWGADLYVRLFQPPRDALKIYVIAKQWMWKVEHAGGQREINALHIPTGRPIELVMTSEDVIHDFSVPAFRIKHDVLPDRYETLVVHGDPPRHLFASIARNSAAWTTPRWWARSWCFRRPSFNPGWRRMAARHARGGGPGLVHALRLQRLSWRQRRRRERCAKHGARAVPCRVCMAVPVPLSDGTMVIADDRYLHDSIVRPQSQIVAGYAPLMPSFAGQIGEEDLLKLIAYIKSLAPESPMNSPPCTAPWSKPARSKAPTSRTASRFAAGF